MTELKRLFTKIGVGFTACWPWVGNADIDGYGKLKVSREGRFVNARAHRVSWELFNGKIPPNQCVCHSCDNPSCVNPFHLFLGTSADNMRDKIKKGRLVSSPGSSNGFSKLTENDVREVRQLLSEGVSRKNLARTYKVSIQTIDRIATRKTWRHI